MAYSCVRVQFEVGHEASIRNKRTPDGFTHDWEVFVRGADNAEIHHFVDKVVFHLHETFPKPKRIFKEPPYVVKESGYAGFNLPIDIYVKTKEEGARKIRLYYDLTLQPLGTGSARISNVTREKHDFTNPAEDLRRKLIRGGGCGVGSDGIASSDKISSGSSSNNVSNSLNSSSNHLDDTKNSPHSTTKGKGSGGEPPAKKHKAPKEPKSEESRLTNSFAELFGTPIKTVKHSPNPKPPPKPTSESKSHDKVKEPSSKVPKHSPAKEKDRDKSEKDREKRDKESEKSANKEKERSSKDKDGHKEGEKSKEKSRKSGSSSSSVFSKKDFIKNDEDRGKKVEDVMKEKEKSSSKGESSSKTEKKHEDKKGREEKEKKEKHKKEVVEKREVKEVEKEKPAEKKQDGVKEVIKESKDVGGGKHKPEKEEKKSKSAEKSKDKNSTETEKPKHKHKKKDKHRKDEEREKPRKKDKEKEKEVVGSSSIHEVPKGGKDTNAMPPPLIVKEKSPPSSPPPPPPPPPPPAMIGKVSDPLKELLEEMSDQGSDSDFSGSEDIVKREVRERSLTPPPAPTPPPPPPPPAPVKIKEEKKLEILKEEKPEKPKKRDRKGKDEDHRKRKRKHKDRDSSREEPHDKVARVHTEVAVKDEKMSPSPSTESRQSRSPSPEETLFTEDYINQLKDLQHKIMTLQDNADLQKVVQVISETGQFEITQRTFDFDLCALDPSTVKMLQDMFITA